MSIKDYQLLIWSEDPDKLKDFYVSVLGLKLTKELKLPDDYGYAVTTEDGSQIWIGKHSEAKGENKDKYRFIVNFYVSDVKKWYKKLSKKVKMETDVFVMPHTHDWPDKVKRHCFTFHDPDGNLLQMTTTK